jgi:hypothetical protein
MVTAAGYAALLVRSDRGLAGVGRALPMSVSAIALGGVSLKHNMEPGHAA